VLELEVTVVKVDRKETESYSIQSCGTYTENWQRWGWGPLRGETGKDTTGRRLLLHILKTAVRLQRIKLFSGLGVKEITKVTSFFFKMQQPNVYFCHVNKQLANNEKWK